MSASPNFDIRHCAEVAESCLAFNLRRADRLITQLYDDALRPTGIRATQYALLVGLRAMEPATMSTVSEQLGMDRTTLTRNLKVLENAGLAASEPGEDQRERRIVLTSHGHRALQAAYPLWKTAQNRVAKRLGQHGLADLIKELNQLAALES